MTSPNSFNPLTLALVLASCSFSCRKAMYDQAKIKTYEAQALYGEAPPGTVAALAEEPEDRVLPPSANELIARGAERFHIFCEPCHGKLGYGDGVIVKRGLLGTPSYHTAKLREASDSYLKAVIAQGLLRMPSFGSRIALDDRIAIVRYIRNLQKLELDKSSRPSEGSPP